MAEPRRQRLTQPLPPVWFVGLHESIAGGLIDQLPRRFPAETAPNYDGIVQHENDLTRSYPSHRAQFAVLGRAALLGLGVVAIVAFGLSAWNARRLPTATASMADRRGQARLALERLVRLVLSRRPSAQGGSSSRCRRSDAARRTARRLWLLAPSASRSAC